MPLGLLIPLLAPVAVEFFKWFVREVIPNSVVERVPPTLVPAMSAAAGGALAYFAPQLGVDPAIGAELGLAGTGVHQTIRHATTKKG